VKTAKPQANADSAAVPILNWSIALLLSFGNPHKNAEPDRPSRHSFRDFDTLVVQSVAGV
jgi:hypothetical protein